RASIFDFVRRRYPGEPAERITNWMRELTRANGEGESNALGMNFTESSLVVLKCLLENRSFAQVKESLKEHYADEDVDTQERELRQLRADLRRSTLLRPLFVRDHGTPARSDEGVLART